MHFIIIEYQCWLWWWCFCFMDIVYILQHFALTPHVHVCTPATRYCKSILTEDWQHETMFYLQQMHPIMLFDASIFPFFVRVVFTMQFQTKKKRVARCTCEWMDGSNEMTNCMRCCRLVLQHTRTEKIPMSQEPWQYVFRENNFGAAHHFQNENNFNKFCVWWFSAPLFRSSFVPSAFRLPAPTHTKCEHLIWHLLLIDFNDTKRFSVLVGISFTCLNCRQNGI